MDAAVDLPEANALGIGLLAEQRAFERDVIAGDHRKAVQRKDVATLQFARRDGVVGAVGVEAGLEPGPGVEKLAVGPDLGDLADHRGGGMERDLVLRDADGDCLDAGGSADVGDAGHLFDMGDLLGGFDHPEAHRRGRDIDEFHVGKLGLEQGQRVDGDVVELDAEPFYCAGQAADGVEVVVAAPVGVGDVFAAEGAPPRLAAVDAGADRGGDVVVDEQAVAAAELAVEEVGIVIDAVVRGEERGVDVRRGHVGADGVETAAHLGGGEGRRDGLAVAGVVLKSLALHGSLAVAAGSGGFRNRSPARR